MCQACCQKKFSKFDPELQRWRIEILEPKLEFWQLMTSLFPLSQASFTWKLKDSTCIYVTDEAVTSS